MRQVLLMAALAALAGCNTPSIGFAGIDPVRVEVEQSVFDVWIDGNRVEALRLNSEFSPNLAAIAPRAIRAIEQASGCPIVAGSLTGDQAMIRAEINCAR